MREYRNNSKTNIPITLDKLAEIIGGNLKNYTEKVEIWGIASVYDAQPGEITFLSDTKGATKYAEQLKMCKASAVIAPAKAEISHMPVIEVEKPHEGLKKALCYFHPETKFVPGIHQTAFVHPNAKVDASAFIGPGCVIESGALIGPETVLEAQVFIGRNVRIGPKAHLHPQVVVKDGCIIGENTIINSGTIIGSEGFGFYRTQEGHQKIPQVGIVEIGARVEIGANVTIDRATMGKTIIGDGTKIDNLVHIAHNCKIGKNCIIVAQVGLSGSTILEDDVTLAGQVGTVGHVRVGRGTTVAARGVVTHDVAPNSFVSGFPLKPHSEEKKILAALRKLPDIIKTIREIKSHLNMGNNDEK